MTSRVQYPELAWWVVGLTLFAGLIWAAYFNIGVILLAIFIYYATRPLLQRVQRVVPSQTLAVFISLTLFVLPVLLILGYTLKIGINELYRVSIAFGAVNIEPYIAPYVSQDVLGVQWELLITSPQEFFETTSSATVFRRIFGYVLSSVGYVGSLVLNLILVFIIAFYLLRDDARISRWIETHLGIYLPQWDVYAKEVDTDLQTIFFGNILHAIITGLIAVSLYTLLDAFNPSMTPIPYPALVGLLAGIGSLIPIVGTKLVYLPVGIYMALWGVSFGSGTVREEFMFPLVFIGASYILVDQIPDVVIRPYVSTKRIHMGLVMLAYIVGPILFGWYGLFFGPLLLVLGLHFVTHILPYLLEPGTNDFKTDTTETKLTESLFLSSETGVSEMDQSSTLENNEQD